MGYSYLKLNETVKIKNFLKKNWNANHILSKKNKLLIWQHFYNNKIYFYCQKKRNKIQSAMGIINQSRDKELSEISIGILVSSHKMGVYELFKEFSKKNFKLIKAIGLTRQIIPLYKFFKYQTGKLNIYYIKNPLIKKSKISKYLTNSSYLKKEGDVIFSGDVKKIIQIIKQGKIKKYLNWRFAKHPFYKYKYISSFDKKLILIYREIVINNEKFIRIVDFIGSFKNQRKFTNELIKFCIKNKFHFIEFMHYGHEDKFIKKTSFLKKKIYQEIPVYVEPFDNFKKKELYFGYKNSTNRKIKIVRADADADRPNKILN